MKTHMRVARATDHIKEIVAFYRDGLGFEVIGSFTEHDGFDGVMLGHPGAQYHLEFTCQQGVTAGRAPTEENLLVFYLPDAGEWQTAVQRIQITAMGRDQHRSRSAPPGSQDRSYKSLWDDPVCVNRVNSKFPLQPHDSEHLRQQKQGQQ